MCILTEGWIKMSREIYKLRLKNDIIDIEYCPRCKHYVQSCDMIEWESKSNWGSLYSQSDKVTIQEKKCRFCAEKESRQKQEAGKSCNTCNNRGIDDIDLCHHAKMVQRQEIVDMSFLFKIPQIHFYCSFYEKRAGINNDGE